MYSEVLSLVSILLSFLSLIYTVGSTVKDEEKEKIKELGNELKEFYNNFLGWFNRIMNFSSSVLVDGKAGKLRDEERIHEYCVLLQQIKDDDLYYSKVHNFLNTNWSKKLMSVTSIDRKVINEKLRDLFFFFKEFERKLFGIKTTVGYLLKDWNRLSEFQRILRLEKLETEMILFDKYKDLVNEALDRIQNL